MGKDVFIDDGWVFISVFRIFHVLGINFNVPNIEVLYSILINYTKKIVIFPNLFLI